MTWVALAAQQASVHAKDLPMASCTPSHGTEAAAASSHARGTPAVAVGGVVDAADAHKTVNQRYWSHIACPR